MCSIGEDDFGDDGGVHSMVEQRIVQPNIDESITCACSKCGVNSPSGEVYKLNFREAECRDCFLAYTRHKFRAALGSSKILPRGAQVLLVVDGTAESLVLLDMLYYAQTQSTYKRLHCEVRVLYIDDSMLPLDLDQPVEPSLVDKLCDLLLHRYSSFECYTIGLDAIDNIANELKLCKLTENHTHKSATGTQSQNLTSILNSMRSLTSKQDYVKQHRNRLIGKVAAHLNCDFAFMPDISTALATQLLSSIALGRGGSVAMDVALLDDRLFESDSVKLVRPLKDLNELEVQLYLRAQTLKPFRTTSQYGAQLGSSASLQNLTNAFMSNLQQNFGATVSTVFRTGDKIATNRQLDNSLALLKLNGTTTTSTSDFSCNFCKSPLDFGDSTTLLAIEFSRLVSKEGTTHDEGADLNSEAHDNVYGVHDKQLRHLCHACRNMLDDSSNKNFLL